MDTPTSLEPADLTPTPDILTRFSQGEPIAKIAAELHCHPSTLYRYMLRAGGPAAYYEAKVAANQVRVWEADDKLDKAENMLEYNKAHAQAKLARQDYERCCPKEYGIKQELNVDANITINVNRIPVPQPVVVEGVVSDGSSEVIDNREKLEQHS